jgi:AAA+ ATPase superfamily predicted ATPase
MHPFIGREREQAEFRQLLRKKSASLVTCHGRRRVGKSRFVAECAKHADHFLSFVGLPPRERLTKRDQLNAFAERLAAQTKAPKLPLDGWPTAFRLLASQIPTNGSVVLLLDEISWMGIGDPDFAAHIKTAWDELFSARPGLILVLCGSVSSWIEKNILNNTAFVGRCSWQFRLDPLPLSDCAAFWRKTGGHVAATEKLKVLAVTGGIPKYLEEIDPAKTAEQNIARLCFNRGGLLFSEFDSIFHDIFNRKAETYREIVLSLVAGPRTVDRIAKALKRNRGGSLGEALGDLETAGFLRKDVSFDPESGETRPRDARFRLADNYLRFYLKYVEPVSEQVKKGLYHRAPLETLAAWDTIMGLQFENLVLGSMNALMTRMDLGNVAVLNAGPYSQNKTQRREGCQIDLLIRTKQSLYVVETKMRKHIAKTVIDDVKKKVARLRLPSGQSVRTGLVYDGTLDSEISRSDYFDFVVPAADLLR